MAERQLLCDYSYVIGDNKVIIMYLLLSYIAKIKFPHLPTQSNFFADRCKIMQHYVTNLYNIMQHYVIRRIFAALSL